MIIQNKCLGFNLSVTVPDSVEDFDKAAGKPGAALGEAIKNVIYRGWNAEFRRAFLERMEKDSEIPWPVDQKKTDAQPDRKDGKPKTPVHIPEGDYFDLLKAKGYTQDQMAPIAVEVAAGIAFDPAAAEGGGGRIGKEYLTAAEDVIKSGVERVTRVKSKLEQSNPGLTVDLDPATADVKNEEHVKALARAIKTNADRKAREALAELNED